ncbi:MAG TPA: hypothetical protein VNG69_04195 [Casimicrobiaceae bacterium]|nr:hypothetical protein [Casimicrobiaceae bacterium]
MKTQRYLAAAALALLASAVSLHGFDGWRSTLRWVAQAASEGTETGARYVAMASELPTAREQTRARKLGS